MQDPDDRAVPTPAHAPVVPAGVPTDHPNPGLDGVLQDLEGLDTLDVAEHAAVYGRMHTSLTDALARSADSGPDPDR